MDQFPSGFSFHSFEEKLIDKDHSDQKFVIIGDFAQILEIQLQPKQSFRAEAGSMIYMTAGCELKVETGALSDAFARCCCSSTGFLRAKYVNKSNKIVYLGLASTIPNKIVAFDMEKHKNGIVFKSGSFFGSFDKKVEINYHFTENISTGCCGGHGFLLNICKAKSWTFFTSHGAVIDIILKEGEVIKVDTNALVCMEASVRFIAVPTNICAEGWAVAKLTGPGRVIIESHRMFPQQIANE